MAGQCLRAGSKSNKNLPFGNLPEESLPPEESPPPCRHISSRLHHEQEQEAMKHPWTNTTREGSLDTHPAHRCGQCAPSHIRKRHKACCSFTELWLPLEHLQMQWLREGSNMVPGLQVQRKLPRVFKHLASLHKPCIKHSLISVGKREHQLNWQLLAV